MDKKQKYIAKRAIFNALMSGRKLSQLDCEEFQVEDMRTPISHMRKLYEDTHYLRYEWITTPVRRSHIKLYWLEPKTGKETQVNN